MTKNIYERKNYEIMHNCDIKRRHYYTSQNYLIIGLPKHAFYARGTKRVTHSSPCLNETSADVQMCHFLPPDSHSDDFDPASTKSKYDSMDFDSLLREAQYSLRR